MIPAYVINLQSRPDRLSTVLKRFGRVGVNVKSFEATDAKSFCDSSGDPNFVATGIQACWSSHELLMDQISGGNSDYALILEDDAVPNAQVDWPTLLERLPHAMAAADIGYLQLGFISAYYRFSRTGVLEGLSTLLHENSQITLRLDRSRTVIINSSRAGAQAYVISRDFAEKTRGWNSPCTGGPDWFFDSLASRSSSFHGFPKMGRLRRSIVEQESRTWRSKMLDSDIEIK